MAKPKEADGYEVAGKRYNQHEDPRASLAQVFADYKTAVPCRNFTYRMQGNTVTVYCHAHTTGLGDVGRRAAQVDTMSKATDAFIKGLKKHYKEIGAGSLDLKEKSSARGYDIQKVSLNDRWEIVYRRSYDVDDLIGLPEED